MVKCETECRDEIWAKMDGFLPKSILWKAILLFVAVWGIASGIYAVGLNERKVNIKENTKATIENSKTIAVIGRDLEYIKTAQTITNDQLDKVLKELRRDR